MARIDSMVQAFLAQRSVAVVGVSDRRETGCNEVYRRFKAAGYRVWPVNPRLSVHDGDPCYPNLRSVPERPDAVAVFASPAVTDDVVDQCIDLGIGHVWMHCMMGTRPGLMANATSVSPAAVERCHEHGIVVIPGACPNQFLNPDVAHGIMRRLWRTFGLLRVDRPPPAGAPAAGGSGAPAKG